MDLELITQIVTVLIVIVGWGVVGCINSRRDAANKRRDLVVSHLIDNYKILTQEIGQRETSIESITKLENLLSEVQLFGSKREVELARKLSKETADNGVSKIDPLIEEMRNSLRKQLKLEAVEGTTIWLRFTNDFKNEIKQKKHK